MKGIWVCGVLLSLATAWAVDARRSPVLAQSASKTCSVEGAKVVDAYKAPAPTEQAAAGKAQAPGAADRKVQLGDTVAVEVEKGEALVSEACRKKPIVLFLNGLPLKGVTALPAADTPPATWKFVLRITDDSRETWSVLLGRPDFGRRKMTAGLGFEDQAPLESDNTPVLEVAVLPTLWIAIWGAIFLLMLAVFVCLARNTNIIRGGTSNASAPAGASPAYSLSKSQGAWWFFVILAAYLLIGIVTGDFSNSMMTGLALNTCMPLYSGRPF